MKKIQIIAQVMESDRNIYLTMINGQLCGVNYSQGLGDTDMCWFNQFDSYLFERVCEALDQDDEKFSSEFFFPSPYWDEQIAVIDQAIWKHVFTQNILEEIKELEDKIQILKNSL